MQMVRHAKPFSGTNKIRERGVWRDKKRIVINSGNYLVCDGIRINYKDFYKEFGFNYIYVGGDPFLGVDIDNPLTKQEAEELANIFKSLRWKNKINGSLMAGWCVCALICGFLHWRPHVWVTGAAGIWQNHSDRHHKKGNWSCCHAGAKPHNRTSRKRIAQ